MSDAALDFGAPDPSYRTAFRSRFSLADPVDPSIGHIAALRCSDRGRCECWHECP